MGTMKQCFSFLFILSVLSVLSLCNAQTERQKNNTGFRCTGRRTCEAYAYYLASSPNFLDLAAVGDLFGLSRLAIASPSNISSASASAALVPNQPLLVPLTCSCNAVNATFGSLSYANISYAIQPNDTFYIVSTFKFNNLTTYPSVEAVNPNLVATDLSIGQITIFPIFCKCPNNTNSSSNSSSNFMISYVVQPSDNISSIASRFGAKEQSIIDVNGNTLYNYDTIFVPVTRLPVLSQPAVVPTPSPSPSAGNGTVSGKDRTGTVRGLGVGLGVVGLLLILVSGCWVYKEVVVARRERFDEEGQRGKVYSGGKEGKMNMDVKLMANVSDCLDKYRVFGIEELVEATDGFDQSFLIQGSVYRAEIDGEVFAIKKMKWNAYEELKILQKVNHGNLVKLEGFCIDQEEANCYLVYEYVENGSLNSWLHEDKNEKLNWKTRLRIAIDIANGLQYIHEHTRPRVVHKDIKSSNILLDSNMRAKIANFGLAKSGMNAITMHIVGTQGYIAPEYLADGVVSTKMDVFSFGVVLLELISGKEAIDEEGNLLWASAIRTFEVENEQEKSRRLKEWLDKDILRETCSMESLMGVLTIAIACLHRDPSKRPSIMDIVYALSKSEDMGFEISDEGICSPRLMAR
ncbi:Serine/threonine receptor-like kinase NFP, partial [Mucuna pruriens]